MTQGDAGSSRNIESQEQGLEGEKLTFPSSFTTLSYLEKDVKLILNKKGERFDGVFNLADGRKFEGLGKYTSPDGSQHYDGEFKDGKFDG